MANCEMSTFFHRHFPNIWDDPRSSTLNNAAPLPAVPAVGRGATAVGAASGASRTTQPTKNEDFTEFKVLIGVDL